MKIATIARAAVRGLVALASVGALVATGVAWSVQQHVSTTIVTSNALTPHPVLIGQAFTALLVGLDARTDANGNPLPPALLDAIHAGPDEGQLHTDTIILLHVPALPGEPAVAISIPRDSYVQLADGSGKHKINSAYNRGLVAAEKALLLDPELAEAHYARAYLLWSPAGHFAHEQAIQEYRRAIELNGNMADAHDYLGVVYWHIGLFDKALREFHEVQSLDPGNRLAQHRLGMVLVYQGKFEEGLRILRQVPREFNPSIVTYHFAWTLALAGHTDEASRVVDAYLRATPRDPGGVVTSVRAILHAKAGEIAAAERDIQRVRQLGPGFGHFHHAAYNVASAFALLGRPGPAVEWLRRAVDDGLPCYPLLTTDPNLESLRRDPAFQALLADLKPQWERWRRTL